MNIHRALIDNDFFSPDGIQEILAAEDTSGFQSEGRQKAELFRPKLQLALSDNGAPPVEFDLQDPAIKNRWGLR